MGADDNEFSGEPVFNKFFHCVRGFFEKPVVWFRESVVEPNREEYYWYHEKLRRVPTIDQCYTDDAACMYEAEQQYKRDKTIDKFILQILKRRFEYCSLDNSLDPEVCKPLHDAYNHAIDNFFIKYGDLGWKGNALTCYMKQKNRMAWERRHGPVGTGRNPEAEKIAKKKAAQAC